MSHASMYANTQRGPAREGEREEEMDWTQTVAAAVSEFRAELSEPIAMEWEGDTWEGAEVDETTLVVIGKSWRTLS